MSKQRRIETLLDLADMDVEAALVLAAKGNRYAAFHCQQAAIAISRSGESTTWTSSSTSSPTPIHGRRSSGPSNATRRTRRPTGTRNRAEGSCRPRIHPL